MRKSQETEENNKNKTVRKEIKKDDGRHQGRHIQSASLASAGGASAEEASGDS